ncbi:SDR family NAD(P)-dependent oxidoreductase [Tumebacillus permanentifrigoris]|uniref:Phosphopantetheine binding protein n=1 Tax=Tumebacillus permanentifrigoris TaxID=378543 RepID=A0A316D316_9BACL|nr:SDR family NAD(P)-dependent oxidoreductase [Tumebacillus permanentifrigoris]PWK05382.1 phosphopantetheine binding protein [Tumebacillus permanentifrigoris]
MEKLLRFVLEGTSKGQIDKQAAAQLLHLIKSEEWKGDEEIAIIGVSANLPHVRDLDEFWENLKHHVDFIGPFPETRRADIDRYLEYTGLEDIDDLSYLDSAYLKEIDKFDYKLFRLSPKEASLMDPYQRLFLQQAWSAIEDAGYGGKKIAKTATGVFVGYASNAKDCYQKMILEVNPDDMSMAGVGNVTAMMPSRISYLLDLKGPTMVLDTACSSAMVAVHSACQAIRNGDCEMAIAGSVRINLFPYEKEYLKFGLESDDGRTRTFDNLSNGAGMGEAILTILLKPLSKALKDRDHIHAVIKGSAINQDGASIGITAPNPDAQMDVILKAWQKAGINPETLSYIEAHGTGTSLGDPLELDGLERAFRRYTDKNQITALGSVKTNLGHTFESSGLAGLMKCLMVLKNRTIPPNLHFNRPNQKFSFQESPVYVSTRLRPYEGEDPMRCGISSFGFSGTNVHMVMEEAPAIVRESDVQAQHQVFTLSARTETALRESVNNYVRFLDGKGQALHIADICYTANTGRAHFEHRLALVVQDVAELRARLAHVQANGLESSPAQRLFYSLHKVVPPTKTERTEQEITEREKTEFSRRSEEQVNRFLEAQGRDEQPFLDLCELYVRGADVAWEALYAAEPVRKVSLPIYPFEAHRCWLDVPEGRMQSAPVKQPDLFFDLRWKQQRVTTAPARTDRGPVLLLLDEKGLGQQLAQRYRSVGRQVIEVEWGTSYQQVDEHRYVLSGDETEYDQLVHDLQNVAFDKVLHLFSIRERAVTSLEELEATQKSGVYSLFYLTRALAKAQVERQIDVVLVAEHASEVTGAETAMRPENATLFGMGKVVLKEHANLACRCLDLDENASIEAIWGELAINTGLYQVALRDNVRYVEEFTEIDVKKAPDRKLTIREDGVYLITGGTGGIGLEVAKWMASQNRIKLVLINRTPMPARERWQEILDAGEDRSNIDKIRNVQQIEALGATVECVSADVANREQLQAVVDEMRAKFGRFHGVVHGAGVGGGEAIVLRKEQDFHNIFNPKVQGTWNLDELTWEDELDFMVLFSSIATLFSAPTQSEYIAANAYLDTYAAYRNKRGRRTVTINWSTWRETGMSVHHNFTVDTLFKSIMIREAIDGLELVLNKDVPKALIGEINYDSKIIHLLDRFQFGLSKKVSRELDKRVGHVRKNLANRTSATIDSVKLTGRESGAYSDLEASVGMIWAKVLGFAELSIYDNFFELGGDSILALKMANKINEELGVEIGAAELLTLLTVADLVKHLEVLGADASSRTASLYSLLAPIEEQERYPASSAQKRLYVIDQLEGNGITYNLSKAITIDGPLDVDRVEHAFQQLIARHETLRTSFELVDGEPFQRVHPHAEFRVERDVVAAEAIRDRLTAFVRPFDLSRAPLFRIGVFEQEAQRHTLAFDMHHIITDGVSIDILIEEFVKLYEGQALDAVGLQYKDYAAWQQRIRQEGLLDKQEEYWLNTFSGEIPLLELPTDFPRKAVKSDAGDMLTITLSPELRENIYKLTKSTGTTLFMLLFSAYNVLLSKYAAQEDIVIGTPILGRPHRDLDRILGMFVNTLVLRNRPSGEKRFVDFLKEVHEHTIKAFENQDYQLEEFISKLRIQRDRSRNPLFDVLFVLQNVGVSEMRLQDLEITPYEFENTTAKFDLELEAFERETAITLNLYYATDLYRTETATRMLGDYVALLEALCSQGDVLIRDIELESSRRLGEAGSDEDESEDVEFNF